MFAKEWGDLHGRRTRSVRRCKSTRSGNGNSTRLIKAANVRRIKFHGLRHTCATLMLVGRRPAERRAAARSVCVHACSRAALPGTRRTMSVVPFRSSANGGAWRHLTTVTAPHYSHGSR
jgi:hypothetical protein